MTFNFYPLFSATRNIDVTSTSKTIELPSAGLDLYLSNVGTNTAYVRLEAVSGVQASGADFPIRGASERLIRRRDLTTDKYISAIADTGLTTTLKVSAGKLKV